MENSVRSHFNSEQYEYRHVEFMDGEGRPALFTRVRDETVEMPSETGARSREGGILETVC